MVCFCGPSLLSIPKLAYDCIYQNLSWLRKDRTGSGKSVPLGQQLHLSCLPLSPDAFQLFLMLVLLTIAPNIHKNIAKIAIKRPGNKIKVINYYEDGKLAIGTANQSGMSHSWILYGYKVMVLSSGVHAVKLERRVAGLYARMTHKSIMKLLIFYK